MHSRSTIDGRTPSVLAVSTLSKKKKKKKNDWNCIQLQHEHINTTLRAKATNVHCKICCCAVAKPSAEACDFLAIHIHSLTIEDRRGWTSQVFSHSLFFQMTDNTYSSSINTQTRHWGEYATHVRCKLCCCAFTKPYAEKGKSPSLRIRDVEKNQLHTCTERSSLTPLWSYVPTASALEE